MAGQMNAVFPILMALCICSSLVSSATVPLDVPAGVEREGRFYGTGTGLAAAQASAVATSGAGGFGYPGFGAANAQAIAQSSSLGFGK